MRGHEYADLQAFIAVVEHGSFARAATHLRIAPSTLSQTIRSLEERLGVRLLNRTTRSVSVTGAGSRLLARFKPAMEEMEAAVKEARDLRAKPAGIVRLHIPRAAYTALLEPSLGDLYRACPDILLEVVIDDAATNSVATGFDLSIRSRELVEPSMTASKLGGDLRHVAVASPAYLEEHGSPSTPQDLANHRCINWRQPGTAHPYHWEFRVDGRWSSVAVSGPLIVSHCDAAITAALDAVGVAFTLEAYARPLIDSGKLVSLLEEFLPPFPGWFVCSPNHRQVPAAALAVVKFISGESVTERHKLSPIV